MKNKKAKSKIFHNNFSLKSRKAAMEMSIGTVVTIVLLMTALALGIVLIQKIFSGATESVDTINEKVMGEINTMFSEEDTSIVIQLGSNDKAKIKSGTDNFGIAVGAQTYDGSVADRERMQFMLDLDTSETGNCFEKIGGTATRNLINHDLKTWINFDKYQGENVYSRISINVPEATAKCSQKILIDVKDNDKSGDQTIAGSSFTIQVI